MLGLLRKSWHFLVAGRGGCKAALEAQVVAVAPKDACPVSHVPHYPSPAHWQTSYTASRRSVLEKQPCGCLPLRLLETNSLLAK